MHLLQKRGFLATLALVAPILTITASVADAQDTTAIWIRGLGAPQYFAVQVIDIDAAVEWYGTALGVRPVDDTVAEDGSWRIVNMTNNDIFVELIRDDRATKADRALGFAKIGFRVDDLDAIADRVEEATGERPRVLEFARHSIRILQLRDPEGNIIQLSTPTTN